jgi:serine/threonine protein kinase
VEVLPGYVLSRRLGRGGFGEVWAASGPGGVPVALKFLSLDERAGAVEARALESLKLVKHPHTISLFGIWYDADLLVVGMELAEGSLTDALRGAVEGGQAGIPIGQLIEHMREAAKGIDFLNEPRHALDGKSGVSILHGDIKPHNLLLVGGAVKVADFGLARTLERSVASKSGGMTVAYAPPEFFRGQATRQSDQYSLAVSYCQLRTGALPFPGTPHQMMAGHVNHPPGLTALSERERPVVARALAKRPEDRWSDCRNFVEELVAATDGSEPRGTGAGGQRPETEPRAAPDPAT